MGILKVVKILYSNSICGENISLIQFIAETKVQIYKKLTINKNTEVNVIDKLCKILDCKVEDIMSIIQMTIHFE